MSSYRGASWVAAIALGGAVWLGGVQPAIAECSTVDEWPSLARVAPTADRLVIGRVADITSRRGSIPTAFRFEIQETISGADTPLTLTLSQARTTGGCVTSWLRVREGDRLALAFGSSDVVHSPLSGAAYVSGLPSGAAVYMPGIERLTASEVRNLATLPPTDVASPRAEEGSGLPGVDVILLALLASTTLVTQRQWTLRRREGGMVK